MYILELSRGYPTKEYPLNGIFEWDQAKALSGIGEKVVFCALDMRSFLRKRKLGFSHFQCDGIEVYRSDFPLGRIPVGIFRFFEWQCFKKLYKKVVAEQGKPDIIHAHFGRSCGYIANKAKKKYGIDYVVTEHDSIVNNDLISEKERKTLSDIYTSAKSNVAVSIKLAEKLNKIYSARFDYIPNVVDVTSFSISEKEDEKFNYISIGSLDNNKGIDLTIKAFSQIFNDDRIGKLYVVGAGAEDTSLKQLSEELEIKDKVVFTGRLSRNKINELFAKCNAFVLASHSETFGVVYIEAMAAGLPIIATRCGGPESFVNDRVGLLVDVDDIDGLSYAMKYICDNTEKYDAQEIRKYCLDNFSPKVVAKQIVSLMKRVK